MESFVRVRLACSNPPNELKAKSAVANAIFKHFRSNVYQKFFITIFKKELKNLLWMIESGVIRVFRKDAVIGHFDKPTI